MVGADLIEIDRVRIAIKRTSRFCTRVFTPGEIEYCNSKANLPSFAVRFAAKSLSKTASCFHFRNKISRGGGY